GAIDGSRITPLNVVASTGPQPTSCPGPQVTDFVDDAPSRVIYPPAESTTAPGGNIDTLDLKGVTFHTVDSKTMTVTMKVKDLSSVPPLGTLNSTWRVVWSYDKKTWYAEAYSNGPGLQAYDVGTLDGT